MNSEFFHQAVSAFFLVVALFLICWYCLRKSYERGYSKGWRECEKCLIDLSELESGVQEARQEIWKNEGSR